MGSDKHALAFHHERFDLVFEVRHGTCDGVFKAFAHGNVFYGHIAISGIFACRVGIIVFHHGRTHVEASAPDVHLVVAILLGGLFLVKSREGTIVAFVQPPRLNNGQPLAFHLLQSNLLRVDGTFKIRGIANVEVKSSLFHQLASTFCFCLSLVGKFHVYPTREQVLLVPLAFAMANNH